MKKKNLFLHTPPGSKPLYMEEAYFRNAIEKKLCSYFDRWGYLPIETPMIDYFDIYTSFLTERQKKGSIRFVDRDGNLVLLRNDITLFAAKALASRMGENRGSENRLKYYYSGQIMRCREKNAPEEYYQIGCEIVADEFRQEEFEILCILMESAKYLGVPEFYLHIGDISFYQFLLAGCEEKNEIFRAIRKCDSAALKKLLNQSELSRELQEDLLKAASFIGSPEELTALEFSEEAERAIAPLRLLVSRLVDADVGYEHSLVVDLSELSELDYYNGIIFHMYVQGAEMPLVSGGRYDLLFKELGLNKSAVGFSYWLYPLVKVLNGRFAIAEDWENAVITEENLIEDFKTAIRKVNEGRKIRLDYKNGKGQTYGR